MNNGSSRRDADMAEYGSVLTHLFFSFPLSAQAHTLVLMRPVLTYNCSDPFGGTRCYGVDDWNGTVNGAHTTMDVVQLHAGDGHMNNTLWVANTECQMRLHNDQEE